jgi:PAS domain S-box-containing protein
MDDRDKTREQLQESEKLYRLLAENVNDLIWTMDLDLRFTYMSPSVSRLLGFTPEEFVGRRLGEVMPPESLEAAVAVIEEELVKEKSDGQIDPDRSRVVESELFSQDGAIVPIETKASFLRDGSGRPAGLLGISRDITERRSVEKVLWESEEKYRALFESSPVSLWVEDFSKVKNYIDDLRAKGIKNFREYFQEHPEDVFLCAEMVEMVDVNNATLELFKAASKEEMLARLGHVFVKESWEGFRENLIALAEGKPIHEIETVNQTLTGERLNIVTRWSVAPGSRGTLSQVVVSIIDITKRKQAEEALCTARDELEKRVKERTSDLEDAVRALRESEEDHARLAAATESSADGIVITDLNGVIQYVNPAFERITGFSRGECVGRDVQVCSGSENERQFRGEIMEALSRDGIWRGCLVRTKKDGGSYQEERSITAVKDASGKVINYAHIVRDVTEKLRLESIAQAVNTMSNTAYIFSGIRHEIGNPINSVGTVLKLLKSSIDKYDKPAIHNYMDRALNEISTVEALLNNLKSFNMYENPKLGDVNLPDFMDKFLTLVKTDSEKKGVAIAASIAPDVRLCRADPRALQQVLMNVLTNAWDACGKGKDSRISIDVSKHRGMVQIEVSDNGCGMSPDQQENLFKPFYTGKPNGTGLGLPIARKMLAMMNASIEVNSKKNVGTTASIQLPEAHSES